MGKKRFYDFISGIFSFSVQAKTPEKAVEKMNKRISKSRSNEGTVAKKEDIVAVKKKHPWARKSGMWW